LGASIASKTTKLRIFRQFLWGVDVGVLNIRQVCTTQKATKRCLGGLLLFYSCQATVLNRKVFAVLRRISHAQKQTQVVIVPTFYYNKFSLLFQRFLARKKKFSIE